MEGLSLSLVQVLNDFSIMLALFLLSGWDEGVARVCTSVLSEILIFVKYFYCVSGKLHCYSIVVNHVGRSTMWGANSKVHIGMPSFYNDCNVLMFEVAARVRPIENAQQSMSQAQLFIIAQLLIINSNTTNYRQAKFKPSQS